MSGAGSYLQGESDDFEALLHRVELLFVERVAHDVEPQFNVLVAQIPESRKDDNQEQKLENCYRWRLSGARPTWALCYRRACSGLASSCRPGRRKRSRRCGSFSHLCGKC